MRARREMRDEPETFNLVKSKSRKQCKHCLLSYGHLLLSLGRAVGGCDLTARAERPHWAAWKTRAIQPRTWDGRSQPELLARMSCSDGLAGLCAFRLTSVVGHLSWTTRRDSRQTTSKLSTQRISRLSVSPLLIVTNRPHFGCYSPFCTGSAIQR
jgi:hypothetical protein